jgi:hypothetical protein
VAARYAVDLPRFLRTPVDGAEARQRISRALADRERSFLELLERAVYPQPDSPYRQLLLHAGVELGDVRNLVAQNGVEPALARLYDAGVRVTLDEFKGKQPIVRPGLELPLRPTAFDNALATVHLDRLTGGSRGARRYVPVDLRMLAHEAAHHRLFLDALGLAGRPMAIWGDQPSSTARVALRHLKAGETVDRWLSKKPLPTGRNKLMTDRVLHYSVAVSRVVGPGTLAFPEYSPNSLVGKVAGWVATQVENGTPALVDTSASTGVRICLAAHDAGLDIAGTWFRFAGEAYTPGKAAVMSGAGASAMCHYSVSEVGRVGFACTAPAALDDVHLLTEKLAMVQRPRAVPGGAVVPAFYLTTLMTTCPKVMLNVEVDDYGVVETRECGCPLAELGLVTHLRDIRSFEKLAGEGIHFVGDDLFVLVDETLPARFGGAPTDYQLVEERVDGLLRLGIVASPRVGALDEQAVIEVVTTALAATNRETVETLRARGALRVVRGEPHETAGAKLLPLHLAAPGGGVLQD